MVDFLEDNRLVSLALTVLLVIGLLSASYYFYKKATSPKPVAQLEYEMSLKAKIDPSVLAQQSDATTYYTGHDGSQQVPGADAQYPLQPTEQGPSGTLPSSVATFYPTEDCDRFICNGCASCARKPKSIGCQMTDDRGRDYPALIDQIRASKTDEFPFYKMA